MRHCTNEDVQHIQQSEALCELLQSLASLGNRGRAMRMRCHESTKMEWTRLVHAVTTQTNHVVNSNVWTQQQLLNMSSSFRKLRMRTHVFASHLENNALTTKNSHVALHALGLRALTGLGMDDQVPRIRQLVEIATTKRNVSSQWGPTLAVWLCTLSSGPHLVQHLTYFSHAFNHCLHPCEIHGLHKEEFDSVMLRDVLGLLQGVGCCNDVTTKLERMLQRYRVVTDTSTIDSDFHRDVSNVLTELGIPHVNEDHGHVDISIVTNAGRIALQCCGPTHYCFDTVHLEGSTLFRNDLLKWRDKYHRVHVIGKDEWEQVQDKKVWLKSLISVYD